MSQDSSSSKPGKASSTKMDPEVQSEIRAPSGKPRRPWKTVGQFFVIETERMQERCVQIVHVNTVFHDIESKIIGLADGDPGRLTIASQEC